VCKYNFYINTINLKRLQYIVIILTVLFFADKMWAQATVNKGEKVATVVIDAGHGGKDPGALGKHSREKNITLAVALKVGNYIKTYLPDVNVIYTRTTDRFVELKKRGQIANKHNADLFISIHCNSSTSHSPYGTETYVLGSDDKRSNRNMKVAMLENAAILLEDNAEDTYNGFDPNSPESYIIFSLKQNDYKQEKSLMLAEKIQSQFKNRAGRKDRGVHQAGFLVLAGTYMPSVLIELGYLSNATEEKYLLSEKGQAYLASAIYRAVKAYKHDYELDNKSEEAELTTQTTTENNSGIEYRVQFFTSSKKIPLSNSRFKSISEVDEYYHNGLYKYTSGHFKTGKAALQQLSVLKKQGYSSAWIVKMKDNKRYTGKEPAPPAKTKKDVLTTTTALEYRVQFYSSPKKIATNNSRFININQVDVYYHNGLYKYTSGHYKTMHEAAVQQSKLRKKGFKDAFVIKMKNGKRVY